MDIALPVIDGYDATRAIKSDDATKAIPYSDCLRNGRRSEAMS